MLALTYYYVKARAMFLGLDIGTSGVKAVLVDEYQNIIDQAEAPLNVRRPKPLWSEQDPEDWWFATEKAVLDLDPYKRAAVLAVGLSGQMHGATCLNAAGKPLRAAILWNDGRSAPQCAQAMTEFPSLVSISGNLAMPGFTAPKLIWMKENEPNLFSQTAKILLPKDFVRLKMTGDYASDMSDSAGTLWLDVAKREWSDPVLAYCGLKTSHMPELFEGNEFTGELRSSVANRWGMSRVPVVAGAGDNAAGAVGAGAVTSGSGFISLGTSGVTFLSDSFYRENTAGAVHSFCHALPDLWHQMSVTLSAASAVDFVAKLTGFPCSADLYAAAEDANSPGQGAFFLPYLSGERTPHNNPNAKGAFFGLTHEDNRITLAQAALEGVAFALADGIDALKETGVSFDSLSVIGGGARSHYWGKILAACFDLNLHRRGGAAVGPAFGATRLARLALTKERVEDVCEPPAIEITIRPDEMLREHYSERRETFQKLYKHTKELTS